MDAQTLRSFRDSTCKVLMCLLANDKPQDFPSIALQTGKSDPTLRQAFNELRAAGLLIHRRGRYAVDKSKILSLQQKVFDIGGTDVLESENDSGNEQYQQSEKIFSRIKDKKGNSIRGKVLRWLCESTTPKVAEQWALWIPGAGSEFGNPIGFMINCLRENSEQIPPIAERGNWYTDYKEFIQR